MRERERDNGGNVDPRKRENEIPFRRPAPTTGTSILFNRIILAAYRIQRELYSARSQPPPPPFPVAREGKGREFYCRRITRSSIRRLNGSISTPRRVRAFEFRCAFSLSIKQSLLKQSVDLDRVKKLPFGSVKWSTRREREMISSFLSKSFDREIF